MASKSTGRSIPWPVLTPLIVTDGDPLQIRTQMRYVIIRGELSSLDNKHKTLWERYRARR